MLSCARKYRKSIAQLCYLYRLQVRLLFAELKRNSTEWCIKSIHQFDKYNNSYHRRERSVSWYSLNNTLETDLCIALRPLLSGQRKTRAVSQTTATIFSIYVFILRYIIHSFFFTIIYFIRILRLKFAKFQE